MYLLEKSYFASLFGCNGSMGYGVQFVWSELGYAAICNGASSMLARQIWSSSKRVYMVDSYPLLIVVPLEGEK